MSWISTSTEYGYVGRGTSKGGQKDWQLNHTNSPHLGVISVIFLTNLALFLQILDPALVHNILVSDVTRDIYDI